jgi:hypothetical protein
VVAASTLVPDERTDAAHDDTGDDDSGDDTGTGAAAERRDAS